MKKLILICLLATLFVGCTSSTEPEQQATDPTDSAPTVAESPTDPPVALPTAVEEPTETAPEESTSDDTATGDHPTIFLPALTPDEAGEIRDNDHVKGNPDATVTIIEYSDFQWPGCKALDPLLRDLVDSNDNVRVVYRHFALNSIHDHAQKAAEAAEAAGAQGKFWEYHNLLFDNQDNFSRGDEDNARTVFIGIAEELGLDVDRFTQELDDGVYTEYVSLSEQEASGLGMGGTPSVIFNGELLRDIPPNLFYWNAFVDLALLEERKYDAAPEMSINESSIYRTTVTMESGDQFVMDLYAQSAPQTVNSFVFLANEGWFDGVQFHRVLPDFVAQTGDPTGLGVGSPGYTVPNEIDPALTLAETGMVAMANSGEDLNGSQWFITLGDAAFLDGDFTIFGRVVEGMDVVTGITPRDPAQNPELPPGDRIQTIEIEEVTQ